MAAKNKRASWFQVTPNPDVEKPIKVQNMNAGRKEIVNFLLRAGFKRISKREFIDPKTNIVRVLSR